MINDKHESFDQERCNHTSGANSSLFIENIPLSSKNKWRQEIINFKSSYYCTWEYNNAIQEVY